MSSSDLARAWAPVDLIAIAPFIHAPAAPAPAIDQPDPAALRMELDAVYADGYQEGHRAGLDEGRRLEAERLRSAHELLEGVVAEIRGAEQRWTAAARENIAALAAAMAMHIVGRELRGDAQAIADLVRRALAEFPLDEPVRVRLHPHDLSTITVASTSGGTAISIAPGRTLRWVADPAIRPGGCLIEGRERIVDGRVDRALERIYRALADG
jgi:flagellar assembly protein FliH